MAERLKYGSMDKPKGDAAPKAEEKAKEAAPAADAPKPAAAAEPAPKADGGAPAKAADATPDPKARHAAAVKALRDMHKVERRDMYKRHTADYGSMQERHDKAIEDMMAANDLELAGPEATPAAGA